MKKILIILLILVAVLSVLLLLREPPSKTNSQQISKNGIDILIRGNSFHLSFDELRKNRLYKFSTKMGDELSGYPLTEIMNFLGVKSSSFSSLDFYAIDGWTVKTETSELTDCYLVFLPS